MTNTVNDYLERLDAALAHVPYATAREIREGVEEELRSLDAAAAHERIRELGDPRQIATAAAGSLREGPTPAGATGGEPQWAPVPPARPSTASPIYVVLTGLAVAFGMWVVPIVGWIAGIVLMWMSAVWRRWEKIVATAVPLVAAAVLAAIAAIMSAIEEQQRMSAYRSEVELSEFHAPGVDQYGASNPFLPASYDLFWAAPFAVGLLNVAVGVWLLAVAFRRGLEPVSPRRNPPGPGVEGARADAAGSAFTAVATAMLVVGVLGALGTALLFARPLIASPLALLAVAGLVMLVMRAVSRR